MSKQDVLFEIGCEELPSKMVLPLAQAMAEGIKTTLENAQIGAGEVIYYGTPRRLAVWIQDVEETQAPQHIVRKGPAKQAAFDAEGQPTPALLGFARSCEVTLDEIQFQNTDKGEWALVKKTLPGAQTLQLLPGFFQEVLAALPISKPMYWGSQVGPFARPVHWVLGLFGAEVIQGTFFDIPADRYTHGHRYHFPERYAISHPSAYADTLRRLRVEPHFETRREQVIQAIDKQCMFKEDNALRGDHESLLRQDRRQFTPVMNDALIDEVTSIVEWPVAVKCSFSEQFLRLPEEVLIASMQAHQKCFALRDPQGKLQPYFITIANIQSENPPRVMAGNEKVMCARLSDADFFYTQDTKQHLETYKPLLGQSLFQVKLGSLQDQLARIQQVAAQFSFLNINSTQVHRAIALSKCDLMTGMVGEFPELQGIMGYYYAQQSGESADISLCIKEQYLPRFAQDDLPTGELGWLLSVLNRLDTLVGIFGIGEKPSGMKDPYKLRRHALALIRLLAQKEAAPTLSACLQAAFNSYIDAGISLAPQTVTEVKTFILERLPAYFSGQGIESELITAVLEVQSESLYDFSKRVHALSELKTHLHPLLGGAKRVHHLLKSVPTAQLNQKIDESLFEEPAERNLFVAMSTVEKDLKQLQSMGQYEDSLLKLCELRPVIDAFFDRVMVMADDPKLRANRLSLLCQLKIALFSVADLSKLNPAMVESRQQA